MTSQHNKSQNECKTCDDQEAEHGISACKVIRWGYVIVFLALLVSILGLTAYLFYLKAQWFLSEYNAMHPYIVSYYSKSHKGSYFQSEGNSQLVGDSGLV